MLLEKQSDLGLHCLLRPLWQATSVGNFRTFILSKLFVFIDVNIFSYFCFNIMFFEQKRKNCHIEKVLEYPH